MKLPKAQPENIPPELQRGARFCLWRYETVNGRENCKIPYNAATGGKAQTNNLETFSEFPAVLDAAAAAPGQYDGIGLGLFGDLAAVDIDHCIDDAGNISALALDIIETMDSYTERSPSGQGIRIIFAAPGISRYMDKEDYEQQYYFRSSPAAPGVEIYIAGMTNRYVTITGDTIRTQTIEDRTRNAYTVLKKYMKRKQPQPQQIQQAPALVDLSDFDIIGRAKAAKNGAEFSALWAGDYTAYPSQSEADFALCSMLAFWTGRDAARIDSLFRQSGLFRDKWEKRSKYRQQTINKAIENCREVYAPPAERPQRAQERPQPVKSVNIPADTKTPQPAADGSEPPQPRKSAVDLFDDFLSEIQSEKYRPIATGMPSLDSLLYGGFEPQSLVMLGAAPGMGKTALAQQIFETMAAGGHEVIYLNLEMSRQQLLARSISRASWKYGNGINAADVMRGYAWTAAQREAITKAAADYRQRIAPRMNYNPDGTTATLESIKETLDNALARTEPGKTAPLVVLDYLQLVQAQQRQDPQEAIKEAIQLLKDYAIRGNTISCAVIAFNRASNNAGRADLGSGRDTSSIEYSADTMLALNYADWESGSTRPLEDLQQENPRQLVLKVLKRRMGDAGRKLYLSFDGSTSRFIPVDTRHSGGFTDLPDTEPLPEEWTKKKKITV